MKESALSLKEKTSQHWFSYFQIPVTTKNRTCNILFLTVSVYDY